MEGDIGLVNHSASNETLGSSMNDLGSLTDSPEYLATAVLAIIGVVVNLVGLATLIQQKKNTNGGNIRTRIILLISLSLSDIVQCMIIPISLYVLWDMILSGTTITSPDSFYCAKTFFASMIPACSLLQLFNLLGMAIDHWLTFTKPFQYFEMMTRKRCLIMVACFWAVFLFLTFSEFLVGLTIFYDSSGANITFCHASYEVMSTTLYSVDAVLLIVAPICLIAMVIIYCSIFREIKKLVVAPPRQQDFGQARRALYTTLVILGSYLVFLLPSYTINAADLILSHLLALGFRDQLTLKAMTAFVMAQQYLFALFIINCILDPLIYMSSLRMKMKKICRSMTRKVFHSYDLVQTTEGNREYGPTSQTLSTVRTSIQMSAGQLPPSEASRDLLTCNSGAD